MKMKIIMKIPIFVFICVLFIWIFYFVKETRNMDFPDENVKFSCNCSEELKCNNCSVLISCVDMVHVNDEKNYLCFKIRNQKEQDTNCDIYFSLINDDGLKVNQTYNIGRVKSKETRAFKIALDFDIENLEFSIEPLCY